MRIVPIWLWVALALAAIGGYSWWVYDAGRDSVQAKWDAANVKSQAEIMRLREAAGKVTTKIEYRTVEKVRTIHEKGDTIIRYRDRFVPADSGMLPGGFRLFYDAAIKNTVPDPARIPDAAPVPVTDVADTHAANAKLCNIAYATVAGWQAWAQEQEALNGPGTSP